VHPAIFLSMPSILPLLPSENLVTRFRNLGALAILTTSSSLIFTVTDVLLWKRPYLTILLLLAATLAYYHLVFRYAGIVPFIADVLLVLASAAGVLKVVTKQFDIR
jgi:hypothetical protein